MSLQVGYPYPGIRTHRSPSGAMVLRLHYQADPDKWAGERKHVPELKLDLSPWAYAELKGDPSRRKTGMTDPHLYLQEYEIDSRATQGQLLFQLDEEATVVEEAFPIPPNWTRYMSLDPHPQVPHAFLWCAVDPWGDRWYYRELWPSRACFRYEDGLLRGSKGPCPEEDNQFRISEYVETIRFLESDQNPENLEAKSYDDSGKRFSERIHKRVIDYAARAFGIGTTDDEQSENFQQRYESHMSGSCKCEPRCEKITHPFFEDAKKDMMVGCETVNEGLKPMRVMGNDGEFHKSSKIHIFRERCPELIFQLKNNRRQQLTATQAAKMDPTGKPIMVRKHQSDNLRYIEMENPVYIRPQQVVSSAPPSEGLSY